LGNISDASIAPLPAITNHRGGQPRANGQLDKERGGGNRFLIAEGAAQTIGHACQLFGLLGTREARAAQLLDVAAWQHLAGFT